jgi:hypothetical protein
VVGVLSKRQSRLRGLLSFRGSPFLRVLIVETGQVTTGRGAGRADRRGSGNCVRQRRRHASRLIKGLIKELSSPSATATSAAYHRRGDRSLISQWSRLEHNRHPRKTRQAHDPLGYHSPGRLPPMLLARPNLGLHSNT